MNKRIEAIFFGVLRISGTRVSVFTSVGAGCHSKLGAGRFLTSSLKSCALTDRFASLASKVNSKTRCGASFKSALTTPVMTRPCNAKPGGRPPLLTLTLYGRVPLESLTSSE